MSTCLLAHFFITLVNSDRVEEADVDIQTDAFLDRPATPMFVPAKTGKDVATQIMKDDVCMICFHNHCKQFVKHIDTYCFKQFTQFVSTL